MSDTKSSSSVGFSGMLALLFIGLKLGGVITWPWLWVLCPLWIPLAFGLAIFLVYLLVAGIGALLK